MSDVFVSYARSSATLAQRVAQSLRAAGFSVWRDDELPAHQAYADVIERELRAAKAVVVLWSNDAAKSQWVRAEADVARQAGTLVQVRLDQCALPLPFDQVQCADLRGWTGDRQAHGWKSVVMSVTSLLNPGRNPGRTATTAVADSPLAERVLAVLPFDNLSNDPEMQFFSDGVSEEIIARLARGAQLKVIGRTSSFQFRGERKVDAARSLLCSHVLDGSIRRAAQRIRVSAHLIEAAT
ncbi:MAG: TIR domain-containing protein, partial [Gammaproteobacteria bacterium]|nr:TIR domain-containing protein [Gammaproteobacteria bacterium]